MSLTIAIVLALCSHMDMSKVQAKAIALRKEFPNAKITVRIDKKAMCDANGEVVTGIAGF